MDGSYPGNVRLWESRPRVRPADPLPDLGWATVVSSRALERAEQLYTREALRPAKGRPRRDDGVEPYSLPWFLSIENQRHGRHGRWLPRLLEFSKHAGETLLGLGDGLGTDWAQYALHGAQVVVCSPCTEQLALVRRNFELRGLAGRFLHAMPSALPLDSASIDVVCVSNLATDDPPAVVTEAYRVLKPGGKVLVVTPARFDVDYWLRYCFPWQRWLGGAGPADEAGSRFSARQLRRLFRPFVERRIHKRHLRRSELPHLWRWAPLALMERLFGHFLILKAFKPLSAALPVPLAA